MSDDDEALARLRAEREAALRQQLEQQAASQAEAEVEAQQAAAEEAAIADVMRKVLTVEARERLARVALGHAELADGARRHLYKMHIDGRLAQQVDDGTLKRLLSTLQPERREPTIRRL